MNGETNGHVQSTNGGGERLSWLGTQKCMTFVTYWARNQGLPSWSEMLYSETNYTKILFDHSTVHTSQLSEIKDLLLK